MIKVKMCGLRRKEDIDYANQLLPDYIGYVFAKKSKRYVTADEAAELTKLLDDRIIPVGVFVNEPAENVISLINSGTIKIAQLHGNEGEEYIELLHRENIPVIKAFIVKSDEDIALANASSAEYVLLDAGMGDGKQFNYELLKGMKRPYFLAGGLSPENAQEVAEKLAPFAVDVSSGIETDGFKDPQKMKKFIEPFRRLNGKDR